MNICLAPWHIAYNTIGLRSVPGIYTIVLEGLRGETTIAELCRPLRMAKLRFADIIHMVEHSDLSTRKTLEELGVPRSTFYRWCRRFQEDGPRGLERQPPQNKRFWNRIPESVREQVVDPALDHLDAALVLMTRLDVFYKRMEFDQRTKLLQLFFKQIPINPEGEIFGHELHSPFAHLSAFSDGQNGPDEDKSGSEQVRLGSPDVG